MKNFICFEMAKAMLELHRSGNYLATIPNNVASVILYFDWWLILQVWFIVTSSPPTLSCVLTHFARRNLFENMASNDLPAIRNQLS